MPNMSQDVQLSWFAQDFPSFSTESPISREVLQFPANWDGWLLKLRCEQVHKKLNARQATHEDLSNNYLSLLTQCQLLKCLVWISPQESSERGSITSMSQKKNLKCMQVCCPRSHSQSLLNPRETDSICSAAMPCCFSVTMPCFKKSNHRQPLLMVTIMYSFCPVFLEKADSTTDEGLGQRKVA